MPFERDVPVCMDGTDYVCELANLLIMQFKYHIRRFRSTYSVETSCSKEDGMLVWSINFKNNGSFSISHRVVLFHDRCVVMTCGRNGVVGGVNSMRKRYCCNFLYADPEFMDQIILTVASILVPPVGVFCMLGKPAGSFSIDGWVEDAFVRGSRFRKCVVKLPVAEFAFR